MVIAWKPSRAEVRLTGLLDGAGPTITTLDRQEITSLKVHVESHLMGLLLIQSKRGTPSGESGSSSRVPEAVIWYHGGHPIVVLVFRISCCLAHVKFYF